MYYGKMLSVCMRYIKDRDSAQEVLQDAFIKVFEKLELFDFRGSIEGWLRRIVSNTAIDAIRKAKRNPFLSGDDNDFKQVAENEMEKQEDLAKEQTFKIEKKDIQYDLFNVPGQSDTTLNKEKNTFLNSSKFYQKNESKLSKKLTLSILKNQNKISLEIFKFQEKENSFGLSFSWNKDKSYFITLEKKDSQTLNEIKKIFEREDLKIIGFDLKHQFKLLGDLDIKIKGKYFDNKIIHHEVYHTGLI